MENASANTGNISQTAQTYGVEHKPLASKVQPAENYVDIATAKGTVNNTDENSPQIKGFDTEKINISSGYAQKYIMPFNKTPTYLVSKNSGDEYSLTNVINNPDMLKNSFVRDFTTQANNRNSYNSSQNLFATLDNTNYAYGRLFFQGNWINTRTPIDPETGKATGVPELIPS